MGMLSAGVFNIANTTMGLYQAKYESQMKKLEANLAADSLESQAARKELEAEEALKLGELRMTEQRIRGEAGIAEQRVDYAHSGVRVDSGSALEATADLAAWNEYERQKIEYQYGLRSWGLNYDAALLRNEAANTRAAGTTSGTGLQTLVGGMNSLFGSFG